MTRKGLLLLPALALAAVLAARAGLPTFPNFENGKGAFAHSREPEACTSCHFAAPPREGAAPAPGKVERHDVVIVGAGLAGLTAAWALRGEDVLVLEKDATGGGKMRRGAWEGIAFSKGAAYFLEPEGEVKRLLDDVGLVPLPIREPSNSVAVGPGKVVIDGWGEGAKDLPFGATANAKIHDLFATLAKRADEFEVPVRDSSAAMLELDRTTAADYFERYGPEVRKVVDPYCRSCFAAPLEEISALAALAFFCFEFSPTYTFPGGLAALPEALERKLGEKVRHGCFVTEIEATADGVRLTYRDAAGKTRDVAARAAIVACSQAVAKYLIKGLAPERRELMDKVYHGAYAVAAVKTSRPVYDSSYDTWFLDGPVTDVIVADWVLRGANGANGDARPPARKAVLSAYMPLLVTGRSELLATPVETLEERVVKQLSTYIPALAEKGVIEGVDLFIHGHAMHVPYPTYLTEVTAKLQEPIGGKIFFAGVELDLPQLESAVWSGNVAARQVKEALK